MRKNKDALQQALRTSLEGIPRQLLDELLRKKLNGVELEGKEQIIERFVELAFSGKSLESADAEKIGLSITDDDLEDLDKKFTKILEDIPNLVADVSVKIARGLLKSLKRRWPDQYSHDLRGELEFRERLVSRWESPLRLLRMLLVISREIGAERSAIVAGRRSKKPQFRNDALFRLHARACQITGEIIHLLEGGYADGALARWRTLHEISVVTALIAENGDDLAERYLLHDVAQSAIALRTYNDAHTLLGFAPFPKTKAKQIEAGLTAACKRFGQEFAQDNGWAAKLLGKKRPTISDLEAAAGRSWARAHYRMASNPVHAGIKGITFRLGMLPGTPPVIAGASNAGLEEPGQCAALSLTQITIAIMDPPWPLDDLVKMRVVLDLNDEAAVAFIRAGRKLKSDHKKAARG